MTAPAPEGGVRALYDVSLLGLGHRPGPFRTGTFRVVENLARALATRGDVALAFCATRSWDAAAGVPRYLAANADLNGVPFSTHRLVLHTAGAVAGLLPELERRTPRTSAHRHARRAFRGAVAGLDRLMPRLRERDFDRFDLLHIPAYALPNRRSAPTGIKRVLTVHDLLAIMHPHFFLRAHRAGAERLLRSIPVADRIICLSRATADDVCTVVPSVDPGIISITSPAADRSLFYRVTDEGELGRVRRRYGISHERYALSVGTREPRKNIATALHAFERAAGDERVADLRFVIVGGRGWMHEHVDELLSRHRHARDRVHVVGYVPDRDLAALYSAALVFLYPSFCEGFGLPVLEAMQCGTPVITSNTSALREVAADAAVTVDPRDVDAIADAIIGMCANTDRREAYSRAGMRRASNFSWQRCARDTVQAYREALAA